MSETCPKCGWPKDLPAPCFCGQAPKAYEDGWCGTCVLPEDRQENFEIRIRTDMVPADEIRQLEETQPHTSRVGLALRARPPQ